MEVKKHTSSPTRENLKTNCIAWVYFTELATVNFGLLGKLCKLGAGGHTSTTSFAPKA